MNNHYEIIKSIIPEIQAGFGVNELKKKVSLILLDAHSKLIGSEFDDVLSISIEAFCENCGCSDDLADLESILNELFDGGVILSETYDYIVKNTACGRWL